MKSFFNHYLNESNYKEFLEVKWSLERFLSSISKISQNHFFSHSNGLKIKDEMDSLCSDFKSKTRNWSCGIWTKPIFKMANKYRYETFVRSSNIKALLSAFTFHFKSKCLNRYGYLFTQKIKLYISFDYCTTNRALIEPLMVYTVWRIQKQLVDEIQSQSWYKKSNRVWKLQE